jgi:hypothetical protein
MDDKIYADPTEPAVLRYGDTTVECPTLGEAALEWQRLPAENRRGQPSRWQMERCTARPR